MSAIQDFRPLDVDGPTRAFGAGASELKRLAPMYRSYHDVDVPQEFLRDRTLWNVVVSQWFFGGLKKDDKFIPKKGIDTEQALRHVGAVLSSFEPGHMEKEAMCAYLLSLWFSDFIPSKDHAEQFRKRIKERR